MPSLATMLATATLAAGAAPTIANAQAIDFLIQS